MYSYMIGVYAYLVKAGKRSIEQVPLTYRTLVVEMLASEVA